MTNCAQPQDHPLQAFLVTGAERYPLGEPGYVYVVQWGDDGPVKIGKAVEPRFRLAELQCANWNELRLVAVVPVVEHMAIVERAAHEIAGEYRLRGEWFDLDPLEAVSAILAAAKRVGVDVFPHAETIALVNETKQQELQAGLEAEAEAHREHLRVHCGWNV